MQKISLKSCCFFGHRKINETKELIERLTETVEAQITDKEITTFYFGDKSDFDRLCLKIVTRLKEKYPYIRRIYVRSANQHIPSWYKAYLLQGYEDTYFPTYMANAGRASYVERNQEMINKSDICIVYYDANYVPPRRKNAKRDLTDYQPASGTKVAYDYAVKRKKEIINVFADE